MNQSIPDFPACEINPGKPREKCGIFGCYAPRMDVARLTYFGLFALQHRGQESAGIAVSSGGELAVYKGMGLVNQVFNEKILGILKGWASSGHVRYSTTGSSVEANAQPCFIKGNGQEVAVSHNGNLINTVELKEELELDGIHIEGSNDSEVIARLIHSRLSGRDSLVPALRETLPKLKGAFSLIVQSTRRIVGVRDSFGIRPLCIGELDGNYMLSSETCGLDIIGAKFVREVKPGEFVVLDKEGVHGEMWADNPRDALCIFEYIYFARPDSYLKGMLLHTVRQKLGANLAKELNGIDADIVVSVPDSGTPHAIGVASELGLPYNEGLIKNRYVGRTFIIPHQKQREIGIRMKLNPLRDVLEGKRVMLVDDSVVRGNTSKQIVSLIRDIGGAREVHMLICSPPVKHPCFYGIDTASRGELIAATKSLKELNDFIGADSINYLSIDGMMDATGLDIRSSCMACFDGHYPIPFPTQMRMRLNKGMLEKGEE